MLLVTDVFLLLTQVLLWILVGLAAHACRTVPFIGGLRLRQRGTRSNGVGRDESADCADGQARPAQAGWGFCRQGSFH